MGCTCAASVVKCCFNALRADLRTGVKTCSRVGTTVCSGELGVFSSAKALYQAASHGGVVTDQTAQ